MSMKEESPYSRMAWLDIIKMSVIPQSKLEIKCDFDQYSGWIFFFFLGTWLIYSNIYMKE